MTQRSHKKRPPCGGLRGYQHEVGYSAYSLAAGVSGAGILDCAPPWPVVAGGMLRSMPAGGLLAAVFVWVDENAYIATPPTSITATAMPAQAAVLIPSSSASCSSSRRTLGSLVSIGMGCPFRTVA